MTMDKTGCPWARTLSGTNLGAKAKIYFLKPQVKSFSYITWASEALEKGGVTWVGKFSTTKCLLVGRPTSSIVPKNIKIGISCYKLVSISI